MSVRVNLLPGEVAERQTASRQRALVGVAVLALIGVLGGATFWQNGRVADAERRLADEQAVLASLQMDEAALAEFGDLEVRLNESNERIETALGAEVSLAGVLQDIAAVMPSDAQFDSLTITMLPDPAPGVEELTVGSIQAVGKSLNNHAPGLERLMLEMDKVAAFHDLFFTSSVLEDADSSISTFTLEMQMSPQVFTGRYVDGMPEELR